MKIDIFLIGVQKAGTSSLYNWVAQHPEICGPELIKDYHYWISPALNKVGWGFIEQQFNNSSETQLKMMGGVNYVYHPTGANVIHDHNPDAKLILVLRNPIKRAISAHSYFTKLGQERLNLQDALQREKTQKLSRYEEISNWSYLDHGLYFNQLENFLKIFSFEKIHILFFEDMIKDNSSAVKEIFNFLNVDKSFEPEFIKVNETGKAKFLWINRLLFGKKGIGKLISSLVKILPLSWRIKFGNWIREKNKTKNKTTTAKPQYGIEVLEKFFIEDVKKLSNLLNIDLLEKWEFNQH